MRFFICFAFTCISLFACSGACLDCHPSLLKNGKYDKDHAVLKTCIKCHSKHSVKEDTRCGADCWDCHNIKEVSVSDVKEHQGLKDCVDCHLKLSLQKAPKLNTKPLFLDLNK